MSLAALPALHDDAVVLSGCNTSARLSCLPAAGLLLSSPMQAATIQVPAIVYCAFKKQLPVPFSSFCGIRSSCKSQSQVATDILPAILCLIK